MLEKVGPFPCRLQHIAAGHSLQSFSTRLDLFVKKRWCRLSQRLVRDIHWHSRLPNYAVLELIRHGDIMSTGAVMKSPVLDGNPGFPSNVGDKDDGAD